MGFEPKFDSIGRVEGTPIIYEPEQFPGAIISFYSLREIKSNNPTFLFWKNVCVGLKDRKDVDSAIHHLLRIISQHGDYFAVKEFQ